MRNKYLSDRASRRSRDRRNPYGAKGGYVRDREDMARGRNRRYDRAMDERHDYAEYDRGDYRRYDREYEDERDYRDYEYDREHRRDYEYEEDYASEKKDYEKKLKEWIQELKRKDRFGSSKEDIIRKAKSMDVKFDEFDEDEFYAVYLMMVSDFKHVANDPHHYLAMAKEWLMDDDVEMTGSDKVCAYLYTIVLGENE